ncbi:hypothetical protein ACQEU3_38885 [Spirillospora sp. CA-253888]
MARRVLIFGTGIARPAPERTGAPADGSRPLTGGGLPDILDGPGRPPTASSLGRVEILCDDRARRHHEHLGDMTAAHRA